MSTWFSSWDVHFIPIQEITFGLLISHFFLCVCFKFGMFISFVHFFYPTILLSFSIIAFFTRMSLSSFLSSLLLSISFPYLFFNPLNQTLADKDHDLTIVDEASPQPSHKVNALNSSNSGKRRRTSRVTSHVSSILADIRVIPLRAKRVGEFIIIQVIIA